MSKNLEREYRALVNSEVPDLWARIEAGLEDKKTAPEESASEEKETDFQTENVRSKKVNFKMWAGLAAACVCVALIVPAMARTLTMVGEGNSYSNSAPQELDSHGKAGSGGQETAEEAIANDAAAPGDNGMGNSVVTSDNATAAADIDHTVSSGQEFAFFRATVEILDIDIRTNGKVLYTAKVIASENADLQVDSEIKIISPVVETEGAVTLEEAQTYDLMLCEEQSDDSGEEKAFLLVNETVE